VVALWTARGASHDSWTAAGEAARSSRLAGENGAEEPRCRWDQAVRDWGYSVTGNPFVGYDVVVERVFLTPPVPSLRIGAPPAPTQGRYGF
jgi:hypothetical protein